ncbi:hypothetical protein BRW84_06770 [Oxalobacter formigenes OXCC13]|nr:hypothetical protein BRW84_06770 [Oxalobacter formigenes OXCC13]
MSTRYPFYFSRKNRMWRLCLTFNRKLSAMKFLLPEKYRQAAANDLLKAARTKNPAGHCLPDFHEPDLYIRRASC